MTDFQAPQPIQSAAKGTWRVDDHPRREYPRVTDARGRFVADCTEEAAPLIAAAPDLRELLGTFTEWARQVAAREDVPRGIRNAAAQLADDGRRMIAKAPGEAA